LPPQLDTDIESNQPYLYCYLISLCLSDCSARSSGSVSSAQLVKANHAWPSQSHLNSFSLHAALFFALGAIDYTNSDRTTGAFTPLAIDMDEETAATRESNEVNNGRLAMFAFWELVRHDIVTDGEPLITGLPFLYQ
jgi:Chlorophyll A-B binding protein